MLPGISVDSCSLDGCLLCQHEHREITGCLNKESSKDSLLMSFSFCHCRKLFSLHYFDWSIFLQKHVLINVLLHSPWFHIVKADNLNSKGTQQVGVDFFFFLKSNNLKYHIIHHQIHQFIFLFIQVSVVRFD